MKKLLLLLCFCLPIQALASDTDVDIVFMARSGVSLATVNIFALDVDNPDAEAIQLTHNTDLGTCYEESDGSDAGFAACNTIQYPPYLGVWQIRLQEGRFISSPEFFLMENIETGESIELFDCVTSESYCGYKLSPDGRWLTFSAEEGSMMADLSLFEAAEPFVFDNSDTTESVAWLNDSQLLNRRKESGRYFVFDTQSRLHYPLESVLNRESLRIELEGVEGTVSMPLPAENPFDESNLPAAIRSYDERVWRPDGAGLIYPSSDYQLPTPKYCERCAVAYWDAEQERSEVLFGLEGDLDEVDGDTLSFGWYLTNLHWSWDSSRFLAAFTQINTYHQPDVFWLYDMETAELREVFHGDWAQWLR